MEPELGPEIEIQGKRPEWLADDEEIMVAWGDVKGGPYPAECVSWGYSTAIRLRADHPIYGVRHPERRIGDDTATPNRLSDELVERMIAFIKEYGKYDTVARAILADLNPDPMIQRARDICKDEFGVVLPDDSPGMRAVMRGLREGGE